MTPNEKAAPDKESRAAEKKANLSHDDSPDRTARQARCEPLSYREFFYVARPPNAREVFPKQLTELKMSAEEARAMLQSIRQSEPTAVLVRRVSHDAIVF